MKNTLNRNRIAVGFGAVLLMAGAVAAQTLIPKYTTIPVVLVDALSSRKARVGDTFKTYCPGPECGGFPVKTEFIGKLTQVVEKTETTPGKIQITFIAANLPDETHVPIEATIAPPDPHKEAAASTPAPEKRKRGALKSGAAGALLGTAVAGNNTTGAIVGGFVGAAAGASKEAKAGATHAASATAANAPKDVEIPAGVKFQIMLSKSVTLGKKPAAASKTP